MAAFSPSDFRRGGRDLADLAAELEHGDPVAEGGGLPELVGDEDDGQTPLDEAAHQRAEFLDALRRQHGGRFVEDEQAAVAHHGAQDLDLLLLAQRQLGYLGMQADGDVERLRDLGDARFQEIELGRCHHGPPSSRFSATVSVGTSIMCWKTVPMPSDRAWRGEVIGVGRAVDQDATLVGLLQSRQHADQRRLAGAVLAEQDMDLARADSQVDTVIGDDAGKALGHACSSTTMSCGSVVDD